MAFFLAGIVRMKQPNAGSRSSGNLRRTLVSPVLSRLLVYRQNQSFLFDYFFLFLYCNAALYLLFCCFSGCVFPGVPLALFHPDA